MQLCTCDSFTPLWRDLNSLCASNLARLLPTVYSNRSERLWLHARIVLVAYRFRIRYTFNPARSPPAVHGDRSERLCLTARTSAVRDWSFTVVIFVKYHEVSSRTIFPNFIGQCGETVLYSRFGAGVGKRGRRRKRTSGKF